MQYLPTLDSYGFIRSFVCPLIPVFRFHYFQLQNQLKFVSISIDIESFKPCKKVHWTNGRHLFQWILTPVNGVSKDFVLY